MKVVYFTRFARISVKRPNVESKVAGTRVEACDERRLEGLSEMYHSAQYFFIVSQNFSIWV